MIWLVPQAIGLIFIYCVVQAIRDARAGNYVWACAAALCALLCIFVTLYGSPRTTVKLEKPVDAALNP